MQETPDFIGDPGRTRTSDLQLRRLLLYPLSYGAKPFRALDQTFAAVRNSRGAEATAARPEDHPAGSLLTKESERAEG
jgi:hypothetical protein